MDQLIRRRFKVHGESGLLMHQRKPSRRQLYDVDFEEQQQENDIYSPIDFNINPYKNNRHRPTVLQKSITQENNFNKIHSQMDFDEDNNDNNVEEKDKDNDDDGDDDIVDDNYISKNVISGQKSSLYNDNKKMLSKTEEVTKATSKRSSSSASHLAGHSRSLSAISNIDSSNQRSAIQDRLTLLDEPRESTSGSKIGINYQNHHYLLDETKSNPTTSNNHQHLSSIYHKKPTTTESRNNKHSGLTSVNIQPSINNSRETILQNSNFPPRSENISSSDKQYNQQHHLHLHEQQKQKQDNSSSSSTASIMNNANTNGNNLTKINNIEENQSNEFLISSSSSTRSDSADQQQHLFFLASSSILFLLIILILYGWFWRRRATTPKSCTKPLFRNSSSKKSYFHQKRFHYIFARPIFEALTAFRSKNSTASSSNKKNSVEAQVIDGYVEDYAGNNGDNRAKNFFAFVDAGSAAATTKAANNCSEHLQLQERRSAGGVLVDSVGTTRKSCASSIRLNNCSSSLAAITAGAASAEKNDENSASSRTLNVVANGAATENNDETIEVIESIPLNSSPSNVAPESAKNSQDVAYNRRNAGQKSLATAEEGNSFFLGNRVVYLKRKLAKSSLVVTAKRSSTKPRVKLITGRVKKFIDDEANEIRSKRLELNQTKEKEPWRIRALSYIFDALSSGRLQSVHNSNLHLSEEEEEQEKGLELELVEEKPAKQEISCCDNQSERVEVHLEQQEPNKNIQQNNQNNQHNQHSSSLTSNEEYLSALNTQPEGASSSFTVEIHHTPIDSATGAVEMNSNPPIESARQVSINMDDKQLSNNLNLFNLDGCSSLSDCSPFLSPSPISLTTSNEPHHHFHAPLHLNAVEHQTCGCSFGLNGFKNTLSPNAMPDANQLNTNAHYNIEYLRTRSQGLVGCSGFVNNEPNSTIPYSRPCCSVSPTALNQQMCRSTHSSIVNGLPPTGTSSVALSCCNSASPSYPHHQTSIQHNSNIGPGYELISGLAHRSDIKSSSFTHDNKFCNIKRQYENYYDDEQEEAYRRLTASIGLDFGLGYHHHHHSPSALTVNGELMQCGVNDTNRFPCTNQTVPVHHHQHNLQFDTQNMNYSHLQMCKCCQKFQPGTQSAYDASTCFQDDHGNTHHKHQAVKTDVHNSTLLKSGAGSDGQLINSPSVSLGGSDSGFVSTTLNNGNNNPNSVCNNPLCQCTHSSNYQQSQLQPQQQMDERPMPPPPMSILVQQPSLVTPPPPPPSVLSSTSDSTHIRTKETFIAQELSDRVGTKVERELNHHERPEQLGTVAATTLELSPHHSPNRRSGFPNGAKSKWRQHVRRLSQRNPVTGELFITQLSEANSRNWISNSSSPRRMSIATDQLSSANLGIDHSTLLERPTQQISNNHLLLQHRASIGTADIHHNQQQQAELCNLTYRQHQNLRLCQPNHNQQQQQLNTYIPSDNSLYEAQYYPEKSSYSSSSSSGIGINGSTCTANTPTSSNTCGLGSRAFEFITSEQPFNERLLAKQNMFETRGHQYQNSIQHIRHQSFCKDQAIAVSGNQTAPYLQHLQMSTAIDPLNVSLSVNPNCFCQQPACQSRKYSLPVQLESQAAERLHSPNMDEASTARGRLLFEKNLDRVDSTNSQSVFTQSCQTGASTSNSSSGFGTSFQQQRLPGEAVQVQGMREQRRISGVLGSSMEPRNGRLIESRRSSQTITRQSSFWLEDNSLDSIVMSSFASGANGQQSESGSQIDVNPLPIDPIPEQQRPSLSSLILSGDSIESVKIKPGFDECNDQKNVELDQNHPQTLNQTTEERSNDNAFAEPDAPSSAPAKGSSKHFGFFPSTSSSSASSATPSNRDHRHYRNLARLRNRLPSSSTSSNTTTTTSSPSPDFSRVSERILGISTHSASTFSKRLPIGKSSSRKTQSKKFPRLGSSTKTISSDSSKFYPSDGFSGSKRYNKDESDDDSSSTDMTAKQNFPTDPKSILPSTSGLNMEKQDSKDTTGSQQSCDTEIDGEFSNINNERILDKDSSSLERQCKELWKLRAALQDDSGAGDSWTNYHQRLNRRYDSGYKSIENQLSSSVEGNVLLNGSISGSNNATSNQSVRISPHESNQQLKHQAERQASPSSLSNRPQSGCSGLVAPIKANDLVVEEEEEDLVQQQSRDSQSKDDDSRNMSPTGMEYKLAELGLEEVTIDCMILHEESQEVGRDCLSRSSRGSNEEELSKKKTPTMKTPASPN